MTIKLTREEAIQDLKAIKSFERYARGRLALDIAIDALKHEQPDEWCTDCKEYDTEKKCCPRFNRVIRGALKREPSEDLISRAETINAITETLDAIDHVPKWVFDKLTSAIEKLPSADRPKGKWHYSDGKPATIGQSFGVICDQCGAESEYCTNFCPNCGADMRGERE